MTISESSYKDLKEYWDYQRKIEYNKELLKNSLKQMDIGPLGPKMDIDDMFDSIWVKVDEDDYENPPKNWIPKNDKLKFDWETDNLKGRPVILRAKKQNEDNNI